MLSPTVYIPSLAHSSTRITSLLALAPRGWKLKQHLQYHRHRRSIMTQCKACSDTVQARSRHYKCTAIRARSFGGTLRCVEDEMTERYYHCNCGYSGKRKIYHPHRHRFA
ncbi:hypothetical protein CTRI78_v000170 [Colletotrichum trifolii]|uniref:Uncharacterized protein n=1 Tax=Colletotrichum trifolii TaxID=5466 RepID=A0A4R8RYS4_COLTR|nr:hypothetical protein CTRI78_v000170 [Colletotrichum trifolii]